ncbi:acyl carrier protein [Streptomyces sp. P9-2B-2]|uniref:acyl carrier protein n=1 Tax=Streptomyces TaxID=1883 RepID=UPI0022586162|nr:MULTISPECIES: acyl carrier protein [Streptomyces]MCX4640458.1 acyl carrier protein [Streptomyces platensis]WJY35886.1 acyl carrier protein [Streptomyces sp. P9-2B-2]
MSHAYKGQPRTATPGIEELVRRTLAERVGAELAGAIPATEKFSDLGIDSLDLVVTLATLERECGVERIADGELWDIADSIGSLTAYLTEHATVLPGDAR